MSAILVIDDDRALCRSLEIQLGQQGHTVRTAGTGTDGVEAAGEAPCDLVLLDLGLPDRNGIDVLSELVEKTPETPVVIVTGRQDTKAAIEAMRRGAFDYLRKPFELDEVLLTLEKARRARATGRTISVTADAAAGEFEIIGSDPKIVEMVKQIGLLARSGVTVLIEGESGTGKELAARALHEASASGGPFVAINCSAVVPTILESELFGHERGAFTDAHARKIGKLEHAGEGTVFFDEIGDMSFDLQAKLLRVLQERQFERVGGLETIRFRARVVAATNRNLESLVKEGRFREDLFYRLAVSRIVVPPLRERRDDVPLLVGHLVRRIARRLHRPVEGVAAGAVKKLAAYDWPGNIRELENVLTRAIALARGKVIAADELEFSLGGAAARPTETGKGSTLAEAEREHIRGALKANGWNIMRTARALDIARNTLRRKIAEYDLTSQT